MNSNPETSHMRQASVAPRPKHRRIRQPRLPASLFAGAMAACLMVFLAGPALAQPGGFAPGRPAQTNVLPAGSAPGDFVPPRDGAPAGAFPGGFGNAGMARVFSRGGAREYIVETYDQDGDGVLNATERATALAARGVNVADFVARAGTAGEQMDPADVENLAGTHLYDESTIRTIFLTLEEEDWEAEMAAFYNTDVHLLATATVDGVVYENVGVRFRGNSTYLMAEAGYKRPIRLKFDLVLGGQGLEGYRTLNLSNSMNDPTFLRTVLYSVIAREYIAAPQVGYVRLVINGENWGVYTNQQQFNSDFVNEFFGPELAGGVRWQVPGSPGGRGGMEYWGDDADLYRTVYEIDNRDRPESWEALINLFRVLNETPLDELSAALEPILDVDGVLRFLALEVALANSDGFWARASDYYIYLDPDGRFHVMPHDFNEALGASGSRNAQLDPLTGLDDASKPLRSRLLAVPELRERYLAHVRDIAENWLDWNVLGPIAAELHDMLAEDVARDTRKLYSNEAFVDGLESLRSFVEQRRAYLLSVTPETTR